MPGRGGVAHRPEPDGLVVADQPFLTQRQRMRLGRQHVQRAPARRPAGRAGTAAVSRCTRALTCSHHALARLLQLGEAAVGAAQVRLRRHQVGLGDPHRGLRPRPWTPGRTARTSAPCSRSAGPRDHLRMPHRDAGDVLHGDRLGVVGQQVRRRPAQPAQRLVQARGQACPASGPTTGITTRNRDQASHAQNSYVLRPADPRPVAPVELQPHPRLGHPRPIRAAAAPPARPPSPPRPPAGSTAPTPGTPSRPASRCTTSARILPLLRSTSSSIFGRNASISLGRAPVASGSPPASRIATYRGTVFASHPANCAAE